MQRLILSSSLVKPADNRGDVANSRHVNGLLRPSPWFMSRFVHKVELVFPLLYVAFLRYSGACRVTTPPAGAIDGFTLYLESAF